MGAGMDVGEWRAERYRKGEDKGEQPYFTFTSIASDSFIRIMEGELEKEKKG
jgi:hypothetical protein